MEEGGNTRRVRIISPRLLINETTKKARRRVEPFFVSLPAPTAARRFVFSVLFEAIFIIINHRSYLSIIEIIEYFIGSSHFVDRAGASNFSLHL